MKIVISGGTGQLGEILSRWFRQRKADVVLITRNENFRSRFGERVFYWDGMTVGNWADEVNAADAMINLSGYSPPCRNILLNRDRIASSRLESTKAIGKAIQGCNRPPKVWLQSSTATIYAHTFDIPNGEDGPLGGHEPNARKCWKFSIDAAKACEAAADEFAGAGARLVKMRTAKVMSAVKGSTFDRLVTLAHYGLGGAAGSGQQYVSWIHEADFVRIIEKLIHDTSIEGTVNVASPHPISNATFMEAVRRAIGAKVGLPLPGFAIELGAVLFKTESESILKSRKVVPERLLRRGFRFMHPHWHDAAQELVGRAKKGEIDLNLPAYLGSNSTMPIDNESCVTS